MTAFHFSRKNLFPDLTYFGFAVLVVGFISAIHFFDPINIYSYGRDVWHHMAVLNALMEHPFDAANPHVVSDAPSRSYMPWFVFLALIGRVFNLSALQVLGLSALFNMTALVLGVRLFAREYFENDWAPLVLLVSLLGAWGIEFNYVGLSNIESLIFGASYPFATVFALGFFAWWGVLTYLKEPKGKWWILAAFLFFSAFAFPTHQLRTGFEIGVMGVLAFFSTDGSFRKGILVGLAIIGGLVLSSFWFYYNSFDFLALGADDSGWQTRLSWYKLGFNVIVVGIGFVGLLGFYNFQKKALRWDLVIGFLAIVSGFIIGHLLGSPISHRFFAFWIFFLHLGLTGFIVSWPLKFKFTENIGCLPLFQKAVVLLVMVMVSFHLTKGIETYYAYSDFGKGVSPPPYEGLRPNIPESMIRLSSYFRPGDVLIANKVAAYPAQAFGIKVVSIPRPFPLVPDMAERQKASLDFFTVGFPDAGRWQIIEKYHVTFILSREFWKEPGLKETLARFGPEIDIDGDLKLIPIDFSRKPPEDPEEGQDKQ